MPHSDEWSEKVHYDSLLHVQVDSYENASLSSHNDESLTNFLIDAHNMTLSLVMNYLVSKDQHKKYRKRDSLECFMKQVILNDSTILSLSPALEPTKELK